MKLLLCFLLLFSFSFSESVTYESLNTEESIELGDTETTMDSDISQAQEDVYYPTRLDVGGFYLYQHKASRKTHSFFGEADLFIPLFQNRDNVFFMDLRVEDFQGSPFEGNFGLGFRHIFDTWMFGIYSFYDRKRSENRNYFNQITAGCELKTDKFTFDANGYFPFGKTSIFDSNFNQNQLRPGVAPFQNIWFIDGKETALWGFDGEIGYRFWGELSLFLGGFYFHKNNVDTVAGPFSRLNWTYYFDSSILNYIGFEGGYSYDNVRKSRAYAGIKLSFFLGGEKSNRPKGLKRRMVEYVRRDYDVVAAGNAETPFERLNNPDGSPVTVIIAKNRTELNTAIGNAPNVVALDGTAGTGAVSTLMDNQFFTGGLFTFGDRGQEIRLSDGGTIENGVILGKDNTVRDLTFKNASLTNDLTARPHVGTLLVKYVSFEGSGADPLAIIIKAAGTDSNITVQNNMFNVTSKHGVSIERENAGALTVNSIENNTFSLTTTAQNSSPIYIANVTTNATANTQTINLGIIANNLITVNAVNIASEGIRIFNQVQTPNDKSQEILGGSIFNNHITVSGNVNGLSGIVLGNEAGGISIDNLSQKIHLDQMSSNQISVSGVSNNTNIALLNFEIGSPSEKMTQEIIVGEILQNNLTNNAGSNNFGIYVVNLSVINNTQIIKAGFNGGFFSNQIQVNAGDDIFLGNDDTAGVIDIKVDYFGQGLSDANNGAQIEKTGNGTITITP